MQNVECGHVEDIFAWCEENLIAECMLGVVKEMYKNRILQLAIQTD